MYLPARTAQVLVRDSLLQGVQGGCSGVYIHNLWMLRWGDIFWKSILVFQAMSFPPKKMMVRYGGDIHLSKAICHSEKIDRNSLR